jgi:HlyD family secretion protein
MPGVDAPSKFTTETRDVLRAAGPPRSKGRRWRWLAVGLLGSLLVGVGVFAWQRARAPKPTTFVTAPLTKGELVQTVTAVGTLAPVDAVDLGAEVTGRLVRVLVDVNDHVEVGQVMAEIDPEQLEARVRQSQAQLESAKASQVSARVSLKEAQIKAERTAELFAQNVVTGDENDTARAALDRAQANLAVSTAQTVVASADLSSARSQLARAVIRAPIAGIVLSRTIEPGQTVTAGFQTPVLFTLARDLSKLELSVEVDEADIAKVREAQTATFVVDAYPGRTFASRVLKLHNMPKAGATVVTYTALLAVDNEDRSLRPGMTATAAIITDRLNDVWLVDNAALRFELPRPPQARRGFLPFPGFGGGGPPGRGTSGGAQRGAAGPGSGAAALPGDRIFLADAAGQPRRVPVQVLATDGTKSALAARPDAPPSAGRRPPPGVAGPTRPAAAEGAAPRAPGVDAAGGAPELELGAAVIVDVAVGEPS